MFIRIKDHCRNSFLFLSLYSSYASTLRASSGSFNHNSKYLPFLYFQNYSFFICPISYDLYSSSVLINYCCSSMNGSGIDWTYSMNWFGSKCSIYSSSMYRCFHPMFCRFVTLALQDYLSSLVPGIRSWFVMMSKDTRCYGKATLTNSRFRTATFMKKGSFMSQN